TESLRRKRHRHAASGCAGYTARASCCCSCPCSQGRGRDYFALRKRRSAASCAANATSSFCAFARSMSLFAFFSASSASFFASTAFASSRSLPRIAVSASTVTVPGCTSRMPPATKTNSTSPVSARSMRTAPGLMRVISGVWRGRMPSSPFSPGSATNFASPEKTCSSAETTSTWIVAMAAPLLDLLGLLEDVVDSADHVESLLGQVVALAVDNHLEAADGFLQRHVLAGRAGEDFSHVEGLRQEALDLARARHGQLVFRAQLIHAENRADVAQLLVEQQHGWI